MTNLVFSMIALLLASGCFSLSTPLNRRCVQTLCDLSRLNLSNVPAAPSALITELDLSFNRLRAITEKDFVAYSSLHYLILSNNIIQKIHERAFILLTYLVELDLSFNRLDTLSAEWFKNLLSLQSLNLLGNRYKMLVQGFLFRSLKKLKILYFGGFYLQSVKRSDFSGLDALEEIVFDGRNLQDYEKGSLRQIGTVRRAAVSLNNLFSRNQTLAEAILSDVVHPNATLTLTDTFFLRENHMTPFRVVSAGGTTGLILKNVSITLGACVALLNILSDSAVKMIAMEDTKLTFHVVTFPIVMKRLEVIFLRNIDIPQFYHFPALFFLKPLLGVVRKLSVLNSKLFLIPCKTSNDLQMLEYMDVSNNILSDMALSQMMCDGDSRLWNLQTLNISRNHLQTINSWLFSNLKTLENIDLSGNMFHSMPDICSWPPRLRFLNLSSTHLRKLTSCLPTSLYVLDVSENALTVFNIELPVLRELYISGNKLNSLPKGRLYPHLTFLAIQNNDLHILSKNDLNDYEDLRSLEAGANTYVCSCDFVAFMTSDWKDHQIKLRDTVTLYVCDSPDAMRGKSVAAARLSVFKCHTAAAFCLLCIGILAVFLLIAVLCHKFNVLWYVRMTWAWLRAKRKPKLRKGELQYDAFISYSEMDSSWVEAHLVPELEQSEAPLRLCLHKRDFVPGGWILDNIMDAIEKSHRTLFVLSQHFVKSEWCKYELDYTHFRLFNHSDDTVVLILLEPIKKETIPRRFCRLRRVMNSRTYLTWPDDDNQIPRFWQNLRTAIRRPETHDEHGLNETLDL